MTGVRMRVVIAWALAMLLAFNYVGASLPKLAGSEAMLSRFQAWGYGGAFLRLIGVLELAGGALVLIPSLAIYGAGIIAVVMLGAIYTHLSTGIGGPGTAAMGLALAGILIALRTPEARGFVRGSKDAPES